MKKIVLKCTTPPSESFDIILVNNLILIVRLVSHCKINDLSKENITHTRYKD